MNSKHMKIKYLILGMATFMMTACQEFLEPDSPSTFDMDYVFSNAEDARKAVNAIYVHFSHDGFRSRLSNNMTANTDIAHQSGWGNSNARHQIWDLNAQENNGDLEYVWEIGYKAIRDANIAIEGILASEAYNSSDAELSGTMKHLLGEAYTLRAYWYSMLTFYFGDVPFMTQAPKAGVEFNLPKEDRNVILSSVIHDLVEIQDDMLWADQLPYGIEQVNREFTMGMIARLSLQRGGYYLTPALEMVRPDDYKAYYDTANQFTAKLIELKDRMLPNDYRQVFLNQSKFVSPVNSDVLFEVPFAIGEGDVGWNIGMNVEGGDHPYGSGGNYLGMTPTYYYSFDTTDVRQDITNSLYYIEADSSTATKLYEALVDVNNIGQGKWSRLYLENPPGKSTAKGTGINWPMMRYADVLLMHAETENELYEGPTEEAISALKRVRERAFPSQYWGEKVNGYIEDVASSKEAFFNALVDERAWELGGEMIRKYDLIRWNIYAEKVQQTVENLKQMGQEAFEGTGNLPPYIWVKHDEDGNITILNKHKKVLAAPDDSWERKEWLISLYEEDDKGTPLYAEWILKDWARYTHPVRYIFPIPTTGISNSKGILKNDGYGF